MGLGDLWSRTLVYFGIAEEEEDWDEDGYVTNEELERTYSERPNVRRLSPRRRTAEFDDWTESGEAAPQRAALRAAPRARLEAMPSPSVRVHLVVPRSFNDAQQIAESSRTRCP